MKKNKIVYGKVDKLPPGPFDPKDIKVRISIIMEGDLLDAIRTKAAAAGTPYQTFMKELLRESLIDKEDQREEIKKLIREVLHEERGLVEVELLSPEVIAKAHNVAKELEELTDRLSVKDPIHHSPPKTAKRTG